MTEMPEVELFSDGGARPNPGKGGYGVILSYKGKKKEFHQGYVMTTNNRMELTGVIKGLEKLTKKSKVKIYTDSQYTINGIQKGWAYKWEANNWYRTKKEKATNYDLWEKLLKLISKHEVEFVWVKGHNGHIENERCDELATMAIEADKLILDENFELKKEEQTIIDIDNSKQKIGKGNQSMKVKQKGDPCKKCLNPVIQKTPKHTKKTLEKKYYYQYFFHCTHCKTNYMPEEAKRNIIDLKI